MRYKCIIFDCDGVLVDSEALSAKVFREMILEMGFEIDFDVVLKQITGTSMADNLNFFSEFTGKKLPPDFESNYRKRSFKIFKTDLKAIDGIHELIRSLKVPLGVASSGPLNKIKLNLTTTGLIENFGDNIFSCYEIGAWKPDPEIYLHAAKKLGFAPKECAVIEDSLTGVKAAIAGGFDVYAFTGNEKSDLFEKLGARIFSKMSELKELLDVE